MASLIMQMGWSCRLCRLAPILLKMFSVTLLNGWLVKTSAGSTSGQQLMLAETFSANISPSMKQVKQIQIANAMHETTYLPVQQSVPPPSQAWHCAIAVLL